MIEFNDVNNTGVYDSTISNSSYAIVYKTNFVWKIEKYVNTTDYGFVVMRTDHEHHAHHFKKGSINIMVS